MRTALLLTPLIHNCYEDIHSCGSAGCAGPSPHCIEWLSIWAHTWLLDCVSECDNSSVNKFPDREDLTAGLGTKSRVRQGQHSLITLLIENVTIRPTAVNDVLTLTTTLIIHTGSSKWRAIDSAVGKQGFKVILLLRMSPLLPFALSNYLYGLTSVDFWYESATYLNWQQQYVFQNEFGKRLHPTVLRSC